MKKAKSRLLIVGIFCIIVGALVLSFKYQNSRGNVMAVFVSDTPITVDIINSSGEYVSNDAVQVILWRTNLNNVALGYMEEENNDFRPGTRIKRTVADDGKVLWLPLR